MLGVKNDVKSYDFLIKQVGRCSLSSFGFFENQKKRKNSVNRTKIWNFDLKGSLFQHTFNHGNPTPSFWGVITHILGV